MAKSRRYDDPDDYRPQRPSPRSSNGPNGCVIAALVTVAVPLLLCGGCMIIGLVGSAGVKNAALPSGASVGESKSTNANRVPPPATQVVSYKELTPSTKFGRSWRAILVTKGITREQLVALATDLHRKDFSSTFRFFDDEAEFDAYRLSDENYPNPRYPSPEEWLGNHYLALLNKIADRNGTRWELWAMDGGYHLVPTKEGQTIAVIK